MNEYYAGLIDWNDPNDALRKLVVPHSDELSEWGDLDASSELAVTPVIGLQHKYPDTALVLCSNACAAYCRYCFRKRLFVEGNPEVPHDFSKALAYIGRTALSTTSF